MAAFEIGSFSRGVTGNFTVLLSSGSTPTAIELWVGNRSATNETDIRRSDGAYDGTTNVGMAIFNATNKGTRSSNSKSIFHYIDSGGATLKLEGTITGFGAGQFTGNMTVVDSNYSIYFKAHF